MSKENLIKKIEDIVIPRALKLGLSLVDLEYLQEGGYWYVRVFIERLEGDVDLEDCAKLSREIEEDIDSLVDKKFFLEVSSPGIERPLKKIKDFEKFVGNKIKVTLKHKIEDKKHFEGILTKCEKEIVFLEVNNIIMEIPFLEIKKSNLVFDFSEF